MRDEGVIYVAGHPSLNRRCTWLPGCIRLRNDLYCVGWGVKLYSLMRHQWRRLHRATCTFTNGWARKGGTVSRTASKKLTKPYWPSRKRSPKRLIVFVEPKKWGARPKKKSSLQRFAMDVAVPTIRIRCAATASLVDVCCTVTLSSAEAVKRRPGRKTELETHVGSKSETRVRLLWANCNINANNNNKMLIGETVYTILLYRGFASQAQWSVYIPIFYSAGWPKFGQIFVRLS